MFRERNDVRRIDIKYHACKRALDRSKKVLGRLEARYRLTSRLKNPEYTVKDLDALVELAKDDDEDVKKAYLWVVRWQIRYDKWKVLRDETIRDYFKELKEQKVQFSNWKEKQ